MGVVCEDAEAAHRFRDLADRVHLRITNERSNLFHEYMLEAAKIGEQTMLGLLTMENIIERLL